MRVQPILLWFVLISWVGSSSLWATETSWIRGNLQFVWTDNPLEVPQGTNGDFDGDGWEDVLLATDGRLTVSWNGSTGLGAFEFLMDGDDAVRWLGWDGVHEVLWVLRERGRLERCVIVNRQCSVQNAFEGMPEFIRLTPGLGITWLHRGNGALEFIGSDEAERIVLSAQAQGNRDAAVIERTNGAFQLIVQDQATGRLGRVGMTSTTGWGTTQWLPGTEGTDAWTWITGAEGWLVGKVRRELWGTRLHSTSEEVKLLSREMSIDFSFFPFESRAENSIDLFLWSPITYGLSVVRLDAGRGSVVDLESITEVNKLSGLLTPDLDGDGQRDLLFPLQDGMTWRYYMQWTDGVRRIFWNGSDDHDGDSIDRSGLEELGLALPWLSALEEQDGLREVWMQPEGLLVKADGDWWEWSMAPDAPIDFRRNPQHPAPQGSCHQLVIPFLELGSNELGAFQPALAEIEPAQWHHLVFSRNEKLETEVWLDGKVLFTGRSKALNYAYNALVFGAYYGTHYQDFGGVSVDRVSLFNRFLTPDEIRYEANLGEPLAGVEVVETWGFEDDNWTSQLAKEPLEAAGSPKLTAGISGRAVSFDGQGDAFRTFVPVPMDEMSLSFFFRLDRPEVKEPQTLLTLYGMYNTWFKLVWRDRSFLPKPSGQDGVIVSPSQIAVSKSTVPEGAEMVNVGGRLHGMSADGTVYRLGSSEWEQASPPCPQRPMAPHRPWSDSEAMFVLSEGHELWRWQEDAGWSKALSVSDTWRTAAVAGAAGAILTNGEEWILTDGTEAGSLAVSEEMASSMSQLHWTPSGEFVVVGKSPAVALNSLRQQPMHGKASEWLAVSRFPSFLMLWLLFILAVFGGIILHRKRQNRRSAQWFLGSPLHQLPPTLKTIIGDWIQNHSVLLDTQTLDEVLSADSRETDETKRGRRSRFVRECNDWGMQFLDHPVVIRMQDAHDKRRTLYQLHPEFVSTWKLLFSARSSSDQST